MDDLLTRILNVAKHSVFFLIIAFGTGLSGILPSFEMAKVLMCSGF